MSHLRIRLRPHVAHVCCALALLGLLITTTAPARAQDADADRERAFRLWEESKMTEALPLLEKLYAANPRDPQVLSRLGWALYVTSGTITDPAARKAARERARTVLIQSAQAGDNSNLTRMGIDALSSADATDIPFSSIKAAEAEMRAGEAAFTQGDLDKAIGHYQRALELDPKLYLAALYIGDMYFKQGYTQTDLAARRGLMDKAGEWFARAIAIDPNVETAYRYWGDALMHSGRQAEARDKFIDAIVAEPGNRNAYVGLSQWAQTNRIALGHPKIDVPTSVTPSQDGKLTINLDPKMLAGQGQGDAATSAWLMYGLTRAAWVKEKFAREFPQEKAYRHTLREEAEALHAVAQRARELAKEKPQSLDPSLANLVKLDDAGLLEAYIFFTRADQGIARDYADYRRANRDKLRRYWAEFVIHGTT